ncbi:bifunctional RNase H/acid phosphatase [Corynebacterium aquatimens]|uniref:Phosphoglycerate mutase n=1 Tax=Corynebacterium aquatimens TaxID=1190508 RepID=A0A931E198_9CORY|nr:bifunctional RNase H/acid phosphatase [Corynebacterium aquatimens]MBG6122032.1 putative phosphoglycerate mutase [Corynebacterium aquatimens]WJY65427.1 Phosphoserine phosphatase 1 [Corynebacterium aquatimens]
MKVTVYSDGGSRGNPGVAGSGTVVYDEEGGTLAEIAYVVGKKASNNVAEYHGLLRGLEAARDLGANEVDVYLDSKLVVEQMSGRWKIKHPDMQKLALEAKVLERGFSAVHYTWVPRAKNKKADELSNVAMDAAARGDGPGVVTGSFVHTAEDVAAPKTAPQAPTSEATPAATGSPAHWFGEKTPPTRFICLRHGQTEHSANKWYSGSSNPPLTDIGQDQARRAADAVATHIQKRFGTIGAVVSSPSERAQSTAQACLTALGSHEIETIDDLREVDFGDFEARSREDVMRDYPDQYAAWVGDPRQAPPNGESQEELFARVTAVRKDLQERYAGQTVLVVTHMMPIKCFIAQALGGGPELARRLFLDLTSINVVEFYEPGADVGVVRCINDTAHLR